MHSFRPLPAAARVLASVALIATSLFGPPSVAAATSPCGSAPTGADSIRTLTVAGVTGTVCEIAWTDPTGHDWMPPSGVSTVDFLAVGGGGAGGYFYYWAVGLFMYTTYNGAAGGGGGGGQVAMVSATAVPDDGFWIQPGYGGETATTLWYYEGYGHDGYPSEVRTSTERNEVLIASGGRGGSQGYPWAASYNPPKGIDGVGGAYLAASAYSVPGVSDASGGISSSDSGTYPPSTGQDATYWGAGGGAGAGGSGADGDQAVGGAGGAGLPTLSTADLFNGASVDIGGGGGGAAFSTSGVATAGTASGGGGIGASSSAGVTTSATAGQDGTGGGGGGGLIATGSTHESGGLVPAYGGSGTVLARYLAPVSASQSPSPTPTDSASPTSTPTESASPTPTPTPTESASPTPTPTESASPTPTPTPSTQSTKATVYFAGNSSKLARTAKAALSRLYTAVRGNELTGATVVGLVNTRKYSAFTKKLAKARAAAVASYLKELGLDVRVRTAIGKGVKGAKSRKATIEIFFTVVD